MTSRSTPILRMAYAGAAAVPLLVIVTVTVRSPVSAAVAPIEPTASGSESPTTPPPLPPSSSGQPPIVAKPGPSGAPTPRPTLPSPTSTGPRLIQSTAVIRDAIDAFHKQIQLHQMHEAVGSMRKLIGMDPSVLEDKGVRSDSMALTLDCQKLPKPDPDDVFEMLVSSMGTVGIDILYEIMTTHGGLSAADYSKELLAREDVRTRGSPALQVAYALKTAKNCDDVRAAYPAAKTDGDKRALGLLYEMQKGCGRRHYGTCCLSTGDKEIAETINAMHARLGIRF